MGNVTSPNMVSFGNPASIIAPDIVAQQMALQRRQQIVDLLRQQALAPTEQQTVTGAGPAQVVKNSPLQGLSKVLSAYLGGKMQNDVDSKTLGMSREMAQRYAAILGGGNPMGGSTPDTTGADPSQPPIDPNAAAALSQGAAAGSPGPTMANALRMDAMPPASDPGMPTDAGNAQPAPAQGGPQAAPPQSAPMPAMQGGAGNNFGLANLLRGSVIEQMGGSPAASAYWDSQKLPDAVKTNNYYGMAPADVSAAMARENAAKGQTLVRNGSTLGVTKADGSFNPLFTAPDTKDNANITWQNGKPVAEQIQGLTAGVQAVSKARTAGEGEVLPYAGQDASGNPLPVTNRTAAATQGAPGPVVPPAPQGVPANPLTTQPGDSDRARIFAGEMAKAQDRLVNPAKYMSPADLQDDPDGSKFRARAQGDIAGLQREMAKLPAQGSAPASGQIFAAPPLGQTPYADAQGKAASDRATATRTIAADSPTRVNVYDNILNLSRSGVNSGPGSAWQNSVKGYVANTPFLSGVSKGWKDDVSGFQELNKFLYQNAQRNWQAAGGTGTDSQLEAFSHSSPNEKMFPQALQAMAEWGKGGELAVQGKATAQDAWLAKNGDNPKQQQAFENTWRTNFDPQLFQLRTMDPARQAAFVQNLKAKNPSAYGALMTKAAALKSIGGL